MSFSAADLEWFHQRDGGEPGIWLATLTGPDLPAGVMRFARNGEDVTSRGELFGAAWFDVSLPGSTEDQNLVSLSFPNVQREVGLAVAEIKSPLIVTLELVRPADWNLVIARVARRKLRNARIDALQVTGEMHVADLAIAPYGNVRMTQSRFPWLGYA